MKKFLTALIALCMIFCLAGCEKNDSLEASKQRDYKVEDILKNDIKIDGIPISIPCTLNELLEALGDDYSVDNDEIYRFIYEGNSLFALNYKNENTYGYLMAAVDSENANFDSIIVESYMSGRNNGIISLSNLSSGDSLAECLEKYGEPDNIYVEEEITYLTYEEGNCFIQINIINDVVDEISDVRFLIKR